jgi:ATP-dependent DNA helicase RecG
MLISKLIFQNQSSIRMRHSCGSCSNAIPYSHTPPQVNTPSTSKGEIAKAKCLKALLSAIGANGSNLRALMESMQRKDRKGFVSTYIVPNIEAGYVAMLYPEAPNHPMQSYYLTKKGRELLERL